MRGWIEAIVTLWKLFRFQTVMEESTAEIQRHQEEPAKSFNEDSKYEAAWKKPERPSQGGKEVKPRAGMVPPQGDGGAREVSVPIDYRYHGTKRHDLRHQGDQEGRPRTNPAAVNKFSRKTLICRQSPEQNGALTW